MNNLLLFFKSTKLHQQLYFTGNRKISFIFIIKKFILNIRYLLLLLIKKRKKIVLNQKILLVSLNYYQNDKIIKISKILSFSKIKHFNLSISRINDLHLVLSKTEIFIIFSLWLKIIFKKKSNFIYMVTDGLIHLFNYYSIYSLLKNNQIKLIITIDPAFQLGRSTELISNKLYGAQSLCIPFGYPISSTLFNNWKFVSYGTYGKKFKNIIDSKISLKNTHIVGNLFCEKELRFHNRKPIKKILFLSFPTNDNLIGQTDGQLSKLNYEFIIDFLINYFKRNNDKVIFNIKLHPADNNKKILKKYNQFLIDQDIRKSLDTYDLFIGISSTVFFEAISISKPYILLTWFNKDTFLLEKDKYPLISKSINDFDYIYNQSKHINTRVYKNIYKKNIQYSYNKSQVQFTKLVKGML